MNILIIDEDQNTLDLCKTCSTVDKNLNFIFYQNYEQGLKTYKAMNIDLIIIDLNLIHADKLLENILSINQAQRTLTVSKELKYIESRGCDYCKQYLNRKRLLKPFYITDFYKTITNFDNIKCSHMHACKNIKKVLKNALNNFISFEFDEKQDSIKSLEHHLYSKQNYLEYINIIGLLDQTKSKYEIFGKNNIKLLS